MKSQPYIVALVTILLSSVIALESWCVKSINELKVSVATLSQELHDMRAGEAHVGPKKIPAEAGSVQDSSAFSVKSTAAVALTAAPTNMSRCMSFAAVQDLVKRLHGLFAFQPACQGLQRQAFSVHHKDGLHHPEHLDGFLGYFERDFDGRKPLGFSTVRHAGDELPPCELLAFLRLLELPVCFSDTFDLCGHSYDFLPARAMNGDQKASTLSRDGTTRPRYLISVRVCFGIGTGLVVREQTPCQPARADKGIDAEFLGLFNEENRRQAEAPGVLTNQTFRMPAWESQTDASIMTASTPATSHADGRFDGFSA